MSITLNFSSQGQSVQLSEKELFDLQNAVTFALNGKGRCSKNFGNIHVEANGNISAFTDDRSQPNIQHVETDC